MHELCNLGVARLAVAAEDDELHAVQAGRLDATRGDQTAAVGKQHDLEHDARLVGAGAGLVIAKARIQDVEIELVVDRVAQRKFKSAGLNLLAQHHRQEPGIAVGRLVSGHVLLSWCERWDGDRADGYSCRLGTDFEQPQWSPGLGRTPYSRAWSMRSPATYQMGHVPS